MSKKPKAESKRQRAHRKAKLFFVPHRHNEYRPHASRSAVLLVAFLFLFAAPLLQNLVQTGSVLGRSSQISAQALLDATNGARDKQGIAGLVANQQLGAAAQLKAQDMLENQYWAHVSNKGTEPWHWVEESGYKYAVAGENLAKNFSTADAVVTAWMSSPEHRKNMLDTAYNDVGFAIAEGELQGRPATIVVAMYGAEQAAFGEAVVQAFSQPAMLTAHQGPLSFAARVGIGLHSLTPTALASIFLLGVLSIVSLLAHAYRKKLPLPIRQSWRKHHGVYKAVAALGMAVFIILLYSGGQL